MAKLDPKQFPLSGSWAHQDEQVNKLRVSSKSLPDGQVKGALIRFPVADGYAVYLVTKLRPLTIQHVPEGDDYCITMAHIRGLNKADIVRQVEQDRRWTKLFSK